ncbi:divergent polysaccharide deacetylase family protein [Paenibacillus sp. LHD-117]|uniref:divergent polysaccharide deacetylase family protein n=1 Tax=Paenibacillus sp. LHD-117 TaxID=3071412 RepID=UPI0027E0C88B|nr:divergent polysaccharide deacetylase family protein [Paenibacillus sp. LHD-117]MDQ6419021.1 divergent polysaccharide deacetylase family protein [Paenibacillus sp. LHD-117]
MRKQQVDQTKQQTRWTMRARITIACALFISAISVLADNGQAFAQGEGQEKTAAEARTVTIVIDDFGNNMTGTEEMLKLPVKFAAAVMPFMPTTKQDAEAAYRLGHDVLIHMPMEPNHGKKSWLGPGAITSDLSDAEIRKRVEDAIADVPHAIGMNNHMGSKITTNEHIMRIVLTVCKEHRLFFLDSKTAYRSVVSKVATELGVPVLENDVFLDDVYTVEHISKQVGVLRKHMETDDHTITIGHVGPPGLKTASVLQQSIPSMQSLATIVKLSDLVRASMGDPLVLPNS